MSEHIPAPLQELMQRLQAPFPSRLVEWKPQSHNKTHTKCLAVPFIDARQVAGRLDEVFGPFGWQFDAKAVGDSVVYGIGVREPETGTWIWKWDTGLVTASTNANDDEQRVQQKAVMVAKGTVSDGLKRAAVLWGIFRYAYSVPPQWVDWDNQTRKMTTPPMLPNWAIPADERQKKPDRTTTTSTAATASAASTAALDVVLPFATKSRPDYKGMRLGDILKTDAGFITWLAGQSVKKPEYEPIITAAQVLVTAGLASTPPS